MRVQNVREKYVPNEEMGEFQEFSLLFALKVRDTAAKKARFIKFLYF